ncbi:Mth938-like domain-containing protein [Candidatus Woesearchaeota archaeon]|nr:Mth938-like domain-containing protein [Candidatus Woesearchaeota archaeon]
MIDNYTFGKFVIDGKDYNSNVILINKTVRPARHLPNHELSLNDFVPLVEAKPEYIIIGTGASGVMPVPEDISNFIKEKGIKLIVEKTGDACQTYNALLKEEKKVAAFLHNTC